MSHYSNKIGIMQGRLSEPISNKIQEFPKNSWKEEFHKASELGFDSIEWIFDIYRKNPIMNTEGIHEIKEITRQTDVKITGTTH